MGFATTTSSCDKITKKKSCEYKASYIANVFVMFLYIKKKSTKIKILLVFIVGDITVFGCAVALEFVASRLSVQHKKLDKTTMFEIVSTTFINLPTTLCKNINYIYKF